MPEPLSLEWWATRPLWLGVAAAAVVPVTMLFGRFERARRGAAAPGRATVAAASVRGAVLDAVCGVAGVAVLLVAGFGPVPAAIALALLVVALIGSARLLEAVRAAARVLAGLGQQVRVPANAS